MYNEDIETGISHNYLEDVKIKNILRGYRVHVRIFTLEIWKSHTICSLKKMSLYVPI